ncbi:MAG: acetate--CoA ligase family protein, partial [Acidobacteriota bacterium]
MTNSLNKNKSKTGEQGKVMESSARQKKIAEISRLFVQAEKEGRKRLLEHEIYSILKKLNIALPEHLFFETGSFPTGDQLKNFKTDKIVLKVVSPEIVHKSDIGGVRFVEKKYSQIINALQAMEKEVRRKTKNKKEIRGFLICEAIAYEDVGFGSELILGLRSSLEFGPVVLVGLGGLDADLLNAGLKEGQGTLMVSARMAEAKSLQKKLAELSFSPKLFHNYRGRKALLKPRSLIQPALSLAGLGAAFSNLETGEGFVIEEAEVNPLVIHRGRLVALDGVCRFSRNRFESNPRPYQKIGRLLKPESIGII